MVSINNINMMNDIVSDGYIAKIDMYDTSMNIKNNKINLEVM